METHQAGWPLRMVLQSKEVCGQLFSQRKLFMLTDRPRNWALIKGFHLVLGRRSLACLNEWTTCRGNILEKKLSQIQPLVQSDQQPEEPRRNRAEPKGSLCTHAKWGAEMVRMTHTCSSEVPQTHKSAEIKGWPLSEGGETFTTNSRPDFILFLLLGFIPKFVDMEWDNSHWLSDFEHAPQTKRWVMWPYVINMWFICGPSFHPDR